MDFALPHIHEKSVATVSNIRHLPINKYDDNASSLDNMLIEAANKAASDLFLENDSHNSEVAVDCRSYPERSTPQSETIEPNSLVVIFESFDNLKFCYAKQKAIFSNRNGHFHHDDFIGKPFGCKIRSRNNQGYGFVYLLKPTPELWARSLNHRTQIIHELDASMIIFYLNLRPNQVVCESGTGSGALSHCIMRTIAPKGMLHTFEFNQQRAETAAAEFAKNGVNHLVTVHHKDVCGNHGPGGFDQAQASVDAIVLDLPEPWSAVPYAAYCIKPNARIVSYSPCVEQSQQTILAMKKSGFHSIRTMEFRLKEHYVDEVEYELPPTEKRPRVVDNRSPHLLLDAVGDGILSGGDDMEANADNEMSEYETEAEQAISATEGTMDGGNQESGIAKAETSTHVPDANGSGSPAVAELSARGKLPLSKGTSKRKKLLVARPFVMMRGHTAFLTFATAGNKLQPNPVLTNEAGAP